MSEIAVLFSKNIRKYMSAWSAFSFLLSLIGRMVTEYCLNLHYLVRRIVKKMIELTICQLAEYIFHFKYD